jgi:ribose 5-phosphate isomerase RpiB
MIFTARQLQDLHKSNGHVTLPYRARLTPLAQDWVKSNKIALGYADVATGEKSFSARAPLAVSSVDFVASAAGTFLWWCDGACGPAKAAITSLSRETNVQTSEIAIDAKRIVEVTKLVAKEIKTGRAAGAILLVQSGAQAMVYANRCPSIRAVLGTCMDAVEQGIKFVAANVLVIEHPYKTFPQVKNLLKKFVQSKHEPSEDVKRQLEELASCG